MLTNLAWRKVLKDLISYFREIQNHYESRSKALVKLGNAANNISTPSSFLKSAGIDDALQLLRDYNKQAVQEANKAREIEEDVILALTGLRSDLQQKIKEIKHLSGDFKNSVDKEMDNTGKAVAALADILDKSEIDEAATTGQQDPFLLRLAVDRQVERQIDEENYLHQVRFVSPPFDFSVAVVARWPQVTNWRRHISTSKALAANSSPLWLARSKRLTTPMLVS